MNKQFRSNMLAFVIGFATCAALARLLLVTPAAAGSPGQFAKASASELVAAVGETVVNLDAYSNETLMPAGGPLKKLFGGVVGDTDPSSVASGVVVSPKGYILTNNHVVADGGRLRARFSDGREFNARVLGRDTHSDLALLKVSGRDLKYAVLGDSLHARPGDSVVAIGNPLGFESSVSVGVVSANRHGPIRVDGQTMGDMIQTDAAINQGNSGGGLFTADGKLIGINTAIMVPRGGSGSIGIGFAVPAHRVKPVLEDLMAHGRVPRPWLGIRYRAAGGGGLIRRVRSGVGVVVEGVVPSSPAEQAGIQPADILQRLGDCPVRCADDVYNFVERYQPGDKIQARVLRGGKERNLSLTLAEQRE